MKIGEKMAELSEVRKVLSEKGVDLEDKKMDVLKKYNINLAPHLVNQFILEFRAIEDQIALNSEFLSMLERIDLNIE